MNAGAGLQGVQSSQGMRGLDGSLAGGMPDYIDFLRDATDGQSMDVALVQLYRTHLSRECPQPDLHCRGSVSRPTYVSDTHMNTFTHAGMRAAEVQERKQRRFRRLAARRWHSMRSDLGKPRDCCALVVGILSNVAGLNVGKNELNHSCAAI